MKLEEYLDKLRECNDEDKLERDFRIYDNWPVLLFGNQDELFLKVTKAFRDSPQEDGIREPWNYIPTEHVFGTTDEFLQKFNYDAGTVVVQIRKSVHGQHKEDEDKINGLIHSVFVMFHPYQEKKMEGVSKFKAMALAIISFGDYMIREKITARLPYNRLDINHIP